ncbi:uncharacterized protein HLK63_K08811 [Nakaseomyces glabratus]|nr:Gcn5-related N-acetyltransferase (GNAT) domain profile [Nakaseomyces glabratus]KAH7596320.1 Gcn5-related N-acetyltransferase (GNAT) domain profile [Nakaseomyces glabratus]KAH7611887.1 Gcn5-related N-acetyltransferase (GNAT) domain profile [Nakaseomyces glabratus]KAI8383808.1 Gcn5-related N-acetyltransferase (GNAT) domain profile [Nakaseomyces glabratus]QNG15783.1 uncharacterized protein GWK60_K08833 [Nakaseomyces glabratus]
MGRSIINLDNVYENNLGMMAKIAKIVYPNQQFEESFFSELFKGGNDKKKEAYMAQIAYYSEIPVGTIKLLLLQKKKSDSLQKGLHIELLAVLEKYDDHEIKEKLLEYALDECKKNHQHKLFTATRSSDEQLMNWYKEHGFTETGSKGEPVTLSDGTSEETVLLLRELD